MHKFIIIIIIFVLLDFIFQSLIHLFNYFSNYYLIQINNIDSIYSNYLILILIISFHLFMYYIIFSFDSKIANNFL